MSAAKVVGSLAVLLPCAWLWCASAAQDQPAAPARVSTVVSPDGAWLAYPVPAYDQDAEEITRIMVCKPDGSAAREVKVISGRCGDVLWVGNDLLWCRTDDGSRRAKWVVLTTAGEARPDVVLPPGSDASGIAVSPDARRVAWCGAFTPPGGKRQFGIFAADIASGQARCMAEGALKSTPAWSPDGRTLAVGKGGYQVRYPLLLIDAETGRITETGIDGVGCAWSPDGRFLAFTTGALRGGGWYAGVPCDGRIGVLDVAAGQLTIVSPEPVNRVLVDEGQTAMQGARGPVWSPDSQRLAYAWDTAVRRGRDNEPACEVWVVRRDGTEPKKVLDRQLSVGAWAPDGSTLYGIDYTSRELVRADVASPRVTVLASWPKPEIPDLPPVEPVIVEKPGVRVSLERVAREYGEAFAAIAVEARREYENVLHLPLPELLTFEVTFDPKGQLALWTDGKSAFFLTITSKAQLAPPTKGGPHNVYGVCHELGHIVMYRGLEDVAGLPPGIGEGWAHYAGSVVVEEVAKRLGDAIWPEPFDVRAISGLGRLERDVSGKDWAALDETTQGAKLFYEVEKLYGRETVGRALAEATGQAKSGKDLMPEYVAALRRLTGDPNAGAWIPEALLQPKLVWKVKERELPPDFFADQKAVPDGTGVLLSYGDGVSAGKRSTSGSGHAVLFQRPEGSWEVDRIAVFGSRYGPPEAPDKKVQVYICDEQFEPIAEATCPQATFERAEPRWYEIAVGPVALPERFYVCIAFNPTATDGVFVHYASAATRSHSRSALPYSHVVDVQGNWEWMIRAHLRPRDASPRDR